MEFLTSQEKSVRHSNIIVSLAFATAILHASKVTVVVKTEGDTATSRTIVRTVTEESDLAHFLDSLKAQFRMEGSLEASLKCISIGEQPQTADSVVAVWRVSDTSPVPIDSIAVSGISHVDPQKISGIFRPLVSHPASENSLKEANNLLLGYRFLKSRGTPYYARYGRKKVALVFPLGEEFQNTASGAAGYLPGNRQEPQVTGEIRLHLENILGTASLVDLWWQRKDSQSQILSLSYEEPLVWKLNLGAKVHFLQNLQDGLYVMRTSGFSVLKTYIQMGRWSVGGEATTVNATPQGQSMGLTNHSVRSFVIENDVERRDNILNPERGYHFGWSAELGDYADARSPNGMLGRLRLKFLVVKSLTGRWIVSWGAQGGYVHVAGVRSVPVSEQFRLGGASNLRGYREQQFVSPWITMGQLELRYILGRLNRVYLFADGASQASHPRLPFSGGVGLQYNSSLGVLRIEYAMNRHDTPSTGKIHVRLVGQF